MKNANRKILDKSFGIVARISLILLVVILAAFIIPIIVKGAGAVVFSATVEHDKFIMENLGYTPSKSALERMQKSRAARAKLYSMLDEYENASPEKNFANSIIKSREASIALARSLDSEIADAAKSPTEKRAKKFSELSKKIWSAYMENLEKVSKEVAECGAEIAFEKSLKDESSQVENSVKEFASLLGERLKLSSLKKSIIRRNLGEYPLSEIGKVIENLERRNAAYQTFKSGIGELLGPRDDAEKESKKLMRQKYGQTRLDIARKVFDNSLEHITIIVKNTDGDETEKIVKSAEFFNGTKVAGILKWLSQNFDELLCPHIAVYTGFFFDDPIDANIFGGIFPMIAGTFYLTLGAMFIASPLGIISAVYFSEYARNGKMVEILRMCVGTLAGVPSIVFGLFGLAFLINTLKISDGKSVFAGSLTLALLVLPTIIRSCEEALKAVPNSYREAALGLGASKWRAVCSVIVPAAMPSMLTGIIISMGRAAGETAPIIFTAATSTGVALGLFDIFTQASPALPWNIYNICTEHEMSERVEHVQYGMLLTLMAIVVGLNMIAICLRIKLQNKTR